MIKKRVCTTFVEDPLRYNMLPLACTSQLLVLRCGRTECYWNTIPPADLREKARNYAAKPCFRANSSLSARKATTLAANCNITSGEALSSDLALCLSVCVRRGAFVVLLLTIHWVNRKQRLGQNAQDKHQGRVHQGHQGALYHVAAWAIYKETGTSYKLFLFV